PLPKDLTVQDPSGKELMRSLEYDWLPNECLMVGHKCLLKEKKAVTRKPVGEKVWQRKVHPAQTSDMPINIQSKEEFSILQKGQEVDL
ncbi:hypothetical protein HAX54_043656, partial [Datura stramonium]|nr:hypothetical protein [Datura stramonium]